MARVRVEDNIGPWARRVERQAVRAIRRVAAEGEMVTRHNRGWVDDTGSASDSITGYVPGETRYDKNYSAPDWRDARRYGGGRYGNPPRNYKEDEHDIDIPKGALTAIITAFVKYALTLEEGWQVGSLTFERSFEEMKPIHLQILKDFLGAV